MLKHYQRGVTLIELMIGLVVSMIVIAGAIAMYLTTVTAGADAVRMARVNQDARSVMNVIVSDLRRTGYCWPEDKDHPGRPVQCDRVDPAMDILIEQGGSSDCIAYFYQKEPLSSGADSDNNHRAFTLHDGRIRMLTGSDSLANACVSNGGWSSLTDETLITVESLKFSTADDRASGSGYPIAESRCWNVTQESEWRASVGSDEFPCDSPESFGGIAAGGDRLVESRVVVIEMTVRDALDQETSMSFFETVRLPNNRVMTVQP